MPRRSVPARFELVRELGSGATGTVYEAIDRELGRTVAVKIVHHADAPAGERLKQEFRIAAGVQHPSLVKLGELFEHEGGWCFSMELIEGRDAVPWVARGTAGAAARTRTLIAQIASALGALHAAGVVHRDVRPSNVLVEPGGRVVLLDLGLASSAGTHGAAMVGTVEYIAPEVARGETATTASDLYSLGVLLHELLTGEPPFTGEPMQILAAKIEHDAPRPSARATTVPDDLDAMCARLCARDPALRPAAAEVVARLGRTARDSAPPPSEAPRLELVGRDAELARLMAAAAAPPGGRTRVVLVRGEAGTGKSALLDAFATRARAAGHLVCTARCSVREHLRWNAWEGLADGLVAHLGAMSPVERARRLPEDAGALAQLFPSFASIVPPAPAPRSTVEAWRRGTAAMRALLGKVAGDARVISILDDAQWATDDSFQLLLDVLAAPSPPVLILLCVRLSATLPPAAMARQRDLRALPVDLDVIDVGPLDDAATLALAQRLTPEPARAASAAAASGGNPLFLHHLLHAPSAPGDDLGALLRERLATATPSQAAVVRTLAAAGRAVRLDVVGRAAGLDHQALVRDLEALVDAMLVRVTGLTRACRAELFHAAVDDAVRTASGERAMAKAHAALAGALEAMADDVELLVEHWVAAGDMPRAAAATLAAAAAARDALAHGRVAALCDLVRTRTLPPATLAAIARARAAALAAAGRVEAAAVAYQEAAATASGDEALDLRRNAAELLLRSGQFVAGLEVARTIGDAVGMPVDLPHGALLGRIALERARTRLRGLRLSARRDERARIAGAACTSLAIGFSMTDALRGVWFSSRAVRKALDSGDAPTAALALAFDGGLVAGRGRRSAARSAALLDRAEALARDTDDMTRGYVAACRCAAAYANGEFARAVDQADRARTLYDRAPGVEFGRRTAELIGMAASYWCGRWGELTRRRAELAAAADATGDRYAQLAATSGFAVVAAAIAGDEAGARERLEAAASIWPTDLAPSSQFRILIGRLFLDVYFRHVSAARFRIEAAWPELEASRLLTIEHVRATMHDLRGRTGLAAGDLDTVAASARELERIPWASGIAHFFRGAIAWSRRDVDATERALTRAIAAADAHRLEAIAAAARYRRGELIGGITGAADVSAALRTAHELGLGDIARPFRFLAPWPDALA